MTVNSATKSPEAYTQPAPASTAAGRFLLLAQGLVILAFAVGLSVQAGLHPVIASSAGFALVVALIALNKIFSARAAARAYANETWAVDQDAGYQEASADASQWEALQQPDPSLATSALSELSAPGRNQVDIPYAAASPSAAVAPPSLAPATPVSAPERPAAMPPPMPRYVEPAPVRAPPSQPQQHRQTPELPTYASSGIQQDYWAHRPSQPRLEDPRPVQNVAAAQPAPAGSDPLRETDVEAIQTLIKKLADEVNLAEQTRSDTFDPARVEEIVAMRGEPALPAPVEHPTASATPPPIPKQAPVAFEPEEAVAQSLAALRSTAGAMRKPSNKVFGHELPPPMPPPPSRAAILAEAISAGRADVLLEPILGLQSQEAEHFEVSIRLRTEDGSPLELDTRDEELHGTGLLPLFDAAQMSRTVSVAQRLADRGKTGSIFSSYSGEALADRTFLADATVASRQGTKGAGQLILTFTQADARGFEAPEWAAISHMRALGFRFALSQVTDLDMNLEGLVQAGFGFVKLDADVFLVGLQSPAGLIPAADVCGYLSGMGLQLVVESINDEGKFGQVFGSGALLGQGQLFGGARVLKAEASATSGRSAA
jgi:cyclic-di-GMP phosphodiesterase, flagellum assembly factor TipF